MYEYTPNPSKRDERLLFWLLIGCGLLLFVFAQTAGLGASVRLLLSCLSALPSALSLYVCFALMLRRYTVRVLPREEGGTDLTVTETLGRRTRVVCRIGLEQIEEVVSERGKSRATLAAMTQGRACYAYFADLRSEYPLCLTVRDGEDRICLRFSSEKRLEDLLKGD